MQSCRRPQANPDLGCFAPLPAGFGLPVNGFDLCQIPLILNQTGPAEWFHRTMKRSKEGMVCQFRGTGTLIRQ